MSTRPTAHNFYFAIVHHNDFLLFDAHFSSYQQVAEQDLAFLKQFVAHAALDLIDQLQWHTQNLFLKCVDKYNDWFVSAFVAPSLVRLVLVHDHRHELGIRNFFNDVFEMYINLSMNPFYEDGAKIQSEDFGRRVEISFKRFLCL